MSPPRTDQSSDSSPPSRTTAEGIALKGPSNLPDPSTHAYRRDLADVALAGQVIASHYAEPLDRVIANSAILRPQASEEGEGLGELTAGEPFRLLDDTLGWAWGYAGKDRRVGYVRSDALGKA